MNQVKLNLTGDFSAHHSPTQTSIQTKADPKDPPVSLQEWVNLQGLEDRG